MRRIPSSPPIPLLVALAMTCLEARGSDCVPSRLRDLMGSMVVEATDPGEVLLVPALPPDQRVTFAPGTFPYASGTRLPDIERPPPPGCVVEVPKELAGTRVDRTEIKVPTRSIKARLKAATPDSLRNEEIAGGAASVVYKVWEPHTPLYILKLRKLQADFKDAIMTMTGQELTAGAIHRDLTCEGLVRQLAAGASLRGRNFLRVAKNLSTRAELLSGTLKMEFVKGPNAAQLADAVARLRQGPNKQASKLLAKAGLGLEEADELLASLEHFYSVSHADVLHYQASARTTVSYSNTSRSTGALLEVGLDYNHGLNVIWSVKERRFVIIDW